MQPFSLPRRDVPCIVLRARDVACDMRRLTLGGPELSAWLARPGVDQPGAWVKVFPPGVPGRAYTLRGIDFEASSVEIDFVVHGDAPGTVSEWARRARPGDAVSIAGPRDGGFSLLADTRWVWLGADASAWPAASRIIESLPGGIQVLGVRHPAGDDDWPAIASARAPQWAARSLPPGGDEPSAPAPDGPGQVWLAGQAAWVKAWRAHWLQRLRFDPARLSAKGYWKAGEQDYKE